MTEQPPRQQPAEEAFVWPSSEQPQPQNFAIAAKICTGLLPTASDATIETRQFPAGWSTNDVFQVSIHSPTQSHRSIVRLPRHQTLPDATATCEPEALRAQWAAENGFGPKVLAIDQESGGFAMEFLQGQTLTTEMSKQRLPQVVDLLQRIHGTEPASCMRRYDPIAVVKEHVKRIKSSGTMRRRDRRLVERIVSDTAYRLKWGHPWLPCHNDFHSHNIMLRRAGEDDNTDCLFAIDFEDCDLGDPMWDLAYLTVNLELESNSSLLTRLYRTSAEEERRVLDYIPLAMVHCATWAALHGESYSWAQHQREVMAGLWKLVACPRASVRI